MKRMHITSSPQRGEGWGGGRMLEVSIYLEISAPSLTLPPSTPLRIPPARWRGFCSSFDQRFQHNLDLFPT